MYIWYMILEQAVSDTVIRQIARSLFECVIN